jgi:hypothetical protein
MAAAVPAMPDADTFAKEVCHALDEVASIDDTARGNWTTAICTALKRRLDSLGVGIECAFDRNARKHEDEREFLFDFCAFLCEPRDRSVERYTVQALIVGEIEWRGKLGRDFEKLMFVDSLVCFFVFPEWIREHQPESEIDFFERVAEQRKRHMARRGTTPPPIFIIACYSSSGRKFITRVVE